jgi:hypothetical protein
LGQHVKRESTGERPDQSTLNSDGGRPDHAQDQDEMRMSPAHPEVRHDGGFQQCRYRRPDRGE